MTDSIVNRLWALSLASSDPIKRAQFDAERAYHISRIGDFTVAREILRTIRSSPISSSNSGVSIWIILAEGVVDFFENLSEGSHDRFRRAHALSIAIGNRELRALSAAWLAHAELERREYQSMVAAANDCLSSFPADGSAAYSRIFIVLANANLYCGNLDSSKKFFERARDLALSDGDRATLGAISHNQAVLLLNSYRLGCFSDLVGDQDFSAVSIAVKSAANFQEITRNTALGDLVSISLARLSACSSFYEAAIERYENLQRSSATYRAGTKGGVLTVEYAHCLAKSGQLARAKSSISGFQLELLENLDNDDKIVALSQLREIYMLLNLIHDSVQIDKSLSDAKVEYIKELSVLRKALEKIQFGGSGNL